MNHDQRQQLLWLWTSDSALTSRVVGWSFHDGNDVDRDLPDLPFERGVDALADGWRLLQAATLHTRPVDDALRTGVLEYEWLFERIVPHAEPVEEAAPSRADQIDDDAPSDEQRP